MAKAMRAKYQLDMNMMATQRKTPSRESDLNKKKTFIVRLLTEEKYTGIIPPADTSYDV